MYQTSKGEQPNPASVPGDRGTEAAGCHEVQPQILALYYELEQRDEAGGGEENS